MCLLEPASHEPPITAHANRWHKKKLQCKPQIDNKTMITKLLQKVIQIRCLNNQKNCGVED
jgi:hypothetical protein